jgi:hypothetical protein
MSDTRLHDFCKGFGALLSRSKVRDTLVLDGWMDPLPSLLQVGLLVVRQASLDVIVG